MHGCSFDIERSYSLAILPTATFKNSIDWQVLNPESFAVSQRYIFFRNVVFSQAVSTEQLRAWCLQVYLISRGSNLNTPTSISPIQKHLRILLRSHSDLFAIFFSPTMKISITNATILLLLVLWKSWYRTEIIILPGIDIVLAALKLPW